jgi:predicted NBD/HSP70 family sugar kinase
MSRPDLDKSKSQIARPNTIREINTQIVLNFVRDLAPISRAEISRATELQRSTVSSIVDSLLKAELIEDIGTGDSTGGRKPNLLKIRTGSAVALGVDVGPVRTTIVVADLAGNVLDKVEFPTSSVSEEETSEIIAFVLKFKNKYQNEELEVGLSVPGITDFANSSVTYVPYFKWHNWDVCDRIAAETGLNVTVDNDANAIALAELWFGREKIRQSQNFITVLVGEGIGTGVVFDGRVYRGEKGDAGEFGHMIVGSKAPVACSCGGFECWEAFSSNTASQARFEALITNNGAPPEKRNVIDLALEGNENAKEALLETAHFLGIGISNLIVGLGPQAVVVSGKITQVWDLISNEVHDAVEKSIRKRLPRTVITASSLPSQPTLIGAVALVLARKFASASQN